MVERGPHQNTLAHVAHTQSLVCRTIIIKFWRGLFILIVFSNGLVVATAFRPFPHLTSLPSFLCNDVDTPAGSGTDDSTNATLHRTHHTPIHHTHLTAQHPANNRRNHHHCHHEQNPLSLLTFFFPCFIPLSHPLCTDFSTPKPKKTELFF